MVRCGVVWCGERRRACTPLVPQLFSSADVLTGVEGHAGEAQVLVRGEHAAREQVRLTQVIDEAADVAVETGVYTVHIPYLQDNRSTLSNFK